MTASQKVSCTADSETSRALGAAPDIQGFSIVPGCQQGAGDSVLARIDFLGNVFLDSCVLFRTSAPPSKTTFPPHRVLLTEPREVSDDENSWATASSEEPESEGWSTREKPHSAFPLTTFFPGSHTFFTATYSR